MYCICVLIVLLIKSGIARKKEDCIKIGATFPVPLQQKNVNLGCKLPDGRKVCCSATNSREDSPGRGVGTEVAEISYPDELECNITRSYESSPYEKEMLAMAWMLRNISDWKERTDRLKSIILSDDMVSDSRNWLKRVKWHMHRSHSRHPYTDAYAQSDAHYLSRYRIKRVCNIESFSRDWIEWIEPLTIHARHPFGMNTCRKVRGNPSVDRSNVDYVLLTSGEHLHESRVGTSRLRSGSGSGSGSVSVRGGKANYIDVNGPPRHYLLDAGTSTFDSSLWWFTCAYSQMGISFNDVYGWEKTLLHPVEYWSKVPDKWKPFWHFYNVGITANSSRRAEDSPLGMLKDISKPNDFVAFKLDIDYPATEMPIAMSLLNNLDDNKLVDEFFFELHFQCEIMMSVNGSGNGCGWGVGIPKRHSGLRLDRPHVMTYFLQLRESGMRAHFWP